MIPGPFVAAGPRVLALDHGKWSPVLRVAAPARFTESGAREIAEQFAHAATVHAELVAALRDMVAAWDDATPAPVSAARAALAKVSP